MEGHGKERRGKYVLLRMAERLDDMHARTYTDRSYEWDPEKAAANQRKHGIDFANAGGVFDDDRALTIRDLDSDREDRFVTVGMDRRARILVVVFTLRGELVRLISARKANNWERRQYEEA